VEKVAPGRVTILLSKEKKISKNLLKKSYKQRLQELFFRVSGEVRRKVWSARDHFVRLTMRAMSLQVFS